ncbi:CpaF family protein [Thermococcus sp. M39]|uniref:CpaF family protein n=1 Tax=unclassified Thermococcus TaxID=2627626 RepID=UPI001439F97F|nr:MULTISPECIES: CpaF family protein [unclassified Thermococcus]NJE08417.1 CpaF family protein [Thermococcus sp. M39]NJE11919.1 CpaF family protein [Thermococcus sp. LS2]
MEDKKKKRSGLSWIEEILSKDAAPLDNIFGEKEREEKYKPPETRFPFSGGGGLEDILGKKPPKEEKTKTPLPFLREDKGSVKLEDILGGPGEKPTPSIPLKAEKTEAPLTLQDILGSAQRKSPIPTYVGEVKVLDAYGNVRILKVKGEPVPIYEIRLPELSKEEERLLKMVRDRAVVEIQIDPESIPNIEERRRIFLKAVRNMVREMAPDLSEGRIEILAELVVQNMIGYGKLDPLVRDDNLEEIMVIGTNKPVYVWHRRFNMCKTNIVFKDDREILNIIERIAREVGRRIDQQSPLLDARLPDGSRVNATIPPISLDGPTITIRKFKKDPLTIIDLIKYGTLNTDVAALLWIFVDGLGVKPANILVAGGTGSGKTTTLNSLAMFIPPSERVISIEDTAELQLPIEHWVRLETRPPNVEGKGEITMDDLVKNTLRMRPDRIIVGEVRGPEARTMFTAMNTGHDGCMGTIHSNSARETIVRLESPPMNVPRIMIPALDIIIMQIRFHSRKKGTIRRITEIAEVSGMEGESIQLNKLYKYDPAKDELIDTGVPSRFMNILAQHTGLSLLELEAEKEKRKIILEWMIEKGIRSIEEVGHYIRQFYIDSEELLKRIERESTSTELAKKVKSFI